MNLTILLVLTCGVFALAAAETYMESTKVTSKAPTSRYRKHRLGEHSTHSKEAPKRYHPSGAASNEADFEMVNAYGANKINMHDMKKKSAQVASGSSFGMLKIDQHVEKIDMEESEVDAIAQKTAKVAKNVKPLVFALKKHKKVHAIDKTIVESPIPIEEEAVESESDKEEEEESIEANDDEDASSFKPLNYQKKSNMAFEMNKRILESPKYVKKIVVKLLRRQVNMI